MIENIFLTYSNLRLKSRPKELEKILLAAKKPFKIDKKTYSNLMKTIDLMVYYESKGHDALKFYIKVDKEFREYIKTHNVDIHKLMEWPWRKGGETTDYYRKKGPDAIFDRDLRASAFYSTFAYMHRRGCDRCAIFEKLSKLFPEGDIEDIRQVDGESLPKCYECWQKYFTELLAQICTEKEYSKLDNSGYTKLTDLINKALNDTKIVNRIEISEKKYPFKARLRNHWEWVESGKSYFGMSSKNDKKMFNDFIYDFVLISLAEFLTKNDRRKLKRCPHCKDFFIAKDIKRVKCYSKDCKKKYEKEKKRKQRKEDLAKYY